MFKKIMCLLIVIGSCIFLNACFYSGDPTALNYGNFDVINYNGNKYYLYEGENSSRYQFWGEYKVIGRYTSNGTAKGDACILENDIEENIIFDQGFPCYFWIKEGYEFIDVNSPVKQIILSKDLIFGYEEVEFSFEVEELTNNKIYGNTKGDVDWSYGKDYIAYLDYGNGIVCCLYTLKNSNNDYYIGKYFGEEKDLHGWYKISDEYMEIFREKIQEYEGKIATEQVN